MADVFPERLAASRANLQKSVGEKLDVPPERPLHRLRRLSEGDRHDCPRGSGAVGHAAGLSALSSVEYAVAKGCHVFMEKSFAVDGPGIRRVLKAGLRPGRRRTSRLPAASLAPLPAAGGGRPSDFHDGSDRRSHTCWAYR